VNTGGFDYDLNVDLVINNVIYTQAGSTCNVQIEVAYDVEIDTTGVQPSWWNGSMFTLQGNFSCAGGSGSSFFNLPNGGGQGTVTSATFSYSNTSCVNVNLNCPITLQISGPQLNYNGPCGALTPITLPVKLRSFSFYESSFRESKIAWSTAYESNLSHFELEKKTSSTVWETVASINAQNSSYGADYETSLPLSVLDQELRLKMLDIDGKITFSKILVIPAPKTNSVSIYPNPTTGTLHLVGFTAKEVVIVNSVGQEVRTKISSDGSVDVSSLAAGIYILYQEGNLKSKGAVRFLKKD